MILFMPGCLGLDANVLATLVGFYLGWLGGEGKGRALGVGEVKFTGQILPTAKKSPIKLISNVLSIVSLLWVLLTVKFMLMVKR